MDYQQTEEQLTKKGKSQKAASCLIPFLEQQHSTQQNTNKHSYVETENNKAHFPIHHFFLFLSVFNLFLAHRIQNETRIIDNIDPAKVRIQSSS